MNSKRISLLDPGLISAAGHHLEWDLRVVDELTSLGHQVEVFAHARADRQVVESFSGRAKLLPLFTVNPYIDPRLIDPVAGELAVFLGGSSVLAQELARIGECDLWLWPSLFAPQLFACSKVAREVRISGCIHVEPSYGADNGRMWWRYAFLMAQRARLRLNVGVTGPLLQKEYAPLTAEGRIDCFPVAHDGAPIGTCKTGLTRIGFFGSQRPEKGAAMLAELASRLLREGFEVVLHDSRGLVRAESSPRLTVLGYVPSLVEEIARCDVVVVPYEPAAYRWKGSGIVWDAIASGIPVIVPSGTAPGLLVEETGAGKTVDVLSIDAIFRAIDDVRQNYERISLAAFEASRRWRTTQGTKAAVAAILSDAVPAH